MAVSQASKRWITPKEAVEEGFFQSEKTAANLRSLRQGPPFSKPPGRRRIIYDRHDLESWVLRGRQLTDSSLPWSQRAGRED